jgi:hypothetical protein
MKENGAQQLTCPVNHVMLKYASREKEMSTINILALQFTFNSSVHTTPLSEYHMMDLA